MKLSSFIENYIKSTEDIVKEFIKTYYTDEDGYIADYYLIWWRDRLHPWPLEVNDSYWWIDNVYEALLHNIPKDILFEWYDYQEAKHTIKNKGDDVICINLTTRYLWEKVYTEEEKAKDQKRLWEIRDMLKESIDKTTGSIGW